jgi:DNA-directed RNA polymerase subunit RPC12/RpoP
MDKVYIKSVVQKILDKEFLNVNKRRIDDYADRINCACPYCGDSSKSVYKKRGNLYFNKLLYICFNCDKKTSFDRFVKDFNEMLDPQKKLEIIEYLDSVVDYSDYDTNFSEFNHEDLVDMKDLEELFNVKKTTPIYDFSPVKENCGVFKYLISRGIPKNLHKNIYQAKFSKGDEGFEHIIIFLNRRGDKVLGLQVRNLKEGRRRFFVIYNWESIYRWINGDDVDIDAQKCVIYNKLSYYFNILNVSFENTITIFEGFIDSLFYPNSIGVVGVNTDLKFLENNNLDLQYFFDNDTAGFDKSEEKIKEGGKVFLWKKLFEDIVSKKKSDDPHQLLYRISKVKDLNKLNELVPGAFKKLNLFEFFSEDIYDIRYLPKKIKKNKKPIEKDYLKEFKWNDL